MKDGFRVYDGWSSLVGGMLCLFSPSLAARFRHGRDMYRSFAAGELEDADRLFRPRNRSGDAEVKKAWRLVAARCRDQAQNNPLISGAIERICANVVRNGIMPQFKFRTVENDKQENKLDRLVNGRWRNLFLRWSRYCDSTGHDSYGALQKLGLRHMWIDGQYLIHRVYDSSLPGVVPLRLEMLEFDQLDALVDGRLASGNIARKGIEYGPQFGRPVAYHLFDRHPGDYLAYGNRPKTIRIPASEIIHVWERRRISQFSGIAWMVAVVMEAYRMEDFRHITQDAARTQALLFGFLESAIPGFNLGTGIPPGGQARPYSPAATGTEKAPESFEPNSIQSVPPGTKMNMITPTHPGDNYEPFVKDSQRWQSAGIGISFEAYTNNYTDASYASARSGSLEERLSYRGQQQFLEEKVNRKIMAWFIEAAFISGLAPVRMAGYAKNPQLYHEMAEGQFPGWGWVDPHNDARAAEKLLQLTLDTHRRQAAQRGQDWDEDLDTLMDEELRLLEYEELREKRLTKKEKNDAAPEKTSGN